MSASRFLNSPDAGEVPSRQWKTGPLRIEAGELTRTLRGALLPDGRNCPYRSRLVRIAGFSQRHQARDRMLSSFSARRRAIAPSHAIALPARAHELHAER